MRIKTGFHCLRGPAPALALALGSLLAGSSLVWGAEIADLVAGHGLSPISPPRPAADFSLPGLADDEQSLSGFSGRWVILTFWASWCGPCRAEMPSLESLHRSHRDKGVVVFGVSVDQDAAAAGGFLEQYRLTFPQAWDQHGEVGRLYRASAIPVSFLIDPRGQLVAQSRGARDWSQLAGLMDSLIEMDPPEAGAAAVYADAPELPGVIDPPSAEIHLSTQAPQVGEDFTLDVHLRWAGQMDEYMPQPPQVHLPEGIIQKAVTASTSSREGARIVVYSMTLQALEPGSFALDPVELRYRPRLSAEMASTRISGPTIEVAPPTVLGLRPKTLVAVVGGMAATVLVGLVAARKWKSGRERSSVVDDSRYDEMLARFKQARTRRMQGDGAGFGLAMLDLLAELQEPGEREADDLASLREGLRFGGYEPPASELDRLQRGVSRQLESLRPDPDVAAREALRLQDDEERS